MMITRRVRKLPGDDRTSTLGAPRVKAIRNPGFRAVFFSRRTSVESPGVTRGVAVLIVE